MIFTVQGMVFAQVLLITPIICGMVYSYASRTAPQVWAFAKTMGASPFQTRMLMIKEMKNEIYFAVIAGFGRSISEVGAVMIVGGNILGKTRTMTTAISLMRNMGNYGEAITLGIILLVIAFLLQSIADSLHKEKPFEENF
jgi:tungstate transport system permease protein